MVIKFNDHLSTNLLSPNKILNKKLNMYQTAFLLSYICLRILHDFPQHFFQQKKLKRKRASFWQMKQDRVNCEKWSTWPMEEFRIYLVCMADGAVAATLIAMRTATRTHSNATLLCVHIVSYTHRVCMTTRGSVNVCVSVSNNP